MKSAYVCSEVNLKIKGIKFQADLVVLTSNGIDVTLGMDWLGECDTDSVYQEVGTLNQPGNR
jgi:hypothetical protein